MYTTIYWVLRSSYKSEISAITSKYQVFDFSVIPQYPITNVSGWTNCNFITLSNYWFYSDKVHAMRSRLSQKEYNNLSVKMELQADCFSGIWAHHAQKMRNILEPGDVEEALNAASMIGDDRLQKQTRGYVSPDSFTHGTSAQRVTWFNRGFRTGKINFCNTFKTKNLWPSKASIISQRTARPHYYELDLLCNII